MRDDNNKTPSDDPATPADRKSMFSDLSEEDEENGSCVGRARPASVDDSVIDDSARVS